MTTESQLSESELAKLRTVKGFRQRGAEMTRLETFTDAAFAFAVTLLVVGGGDSVPSTFQDLSTALMQVPAFAASFANILWFWYAHHVWSRRFGLDDGSSIFLSLLLVLVVLIYIYPLKATYSGAIEFFSGGYFASFFSVSSYQDLRLLFVIFGTAYFAMSGTISLLYRYALRQQEELRLNILEVFESQQEAWFWLINAVVGLVSVLLALGLPERFIPAAGIWYSSLSVIVPLNAWHRQKQRRKLLPPGGTE